MRPHARTRRAHRSLALSTKYSVLARRTWYVYEPFRASNEVLSA